MAYILLLGLDEEELRQKVDREINKKNGCTSQRVFAPLVISRSQAHLSNWLHGTVDLPRQILIQMATFLELPLTERKVRYEEWAEDNPPIRRVDELNNRNERKPYRFKWTTVQKELIIQGMRDNPSLSLTSLAKILAREINAPQDKVKLCIKNLRSTTMKRKAQRSLRIKMEKPELEQ